MKTGHAIIAKGVGKEFAIGAARSRHNTLRDTIADTAGRLLRPFRQCKTPSNAGSFWALRDVNFELRQGEVLGVIGRNGAGKSTLLKILSRITEPTTGEIAVRGRVGSLLEVGTGFHSELSGRENIFLNGAILGMGRAEIARKFDEIVAFAAIERFLDTPVKHYSSGMYLRLGFAVAAHLEPDILVVDEVLAVGDADFQKKCLGKIGEVASEGRTVVFVSHNLDMVQRLCSRCLLLARGGIAADGSVSEVVSEYLTSGIQKTAPGSMISLQEIERTGSGEVRFRSVSFSGDPVKKAEPVRAGGPLRVRIEVEAKSRQVLESLAFCIHSYEGQLLVCADTNDLGRTVRIAPGNNVFEFRFAAVNLMPGRYPVSLWAGDTVVAAYDFIEPAFELEVVSPRAQGLSISTSSYGVVYCEFSVIEEMASHYHDSDRRAL
ncbi:ABC transporter ATP-binding protein [Microvirga sp. TS319]|uniref:ABC transporter ATP-binding protein n=1 Tax=Microvirga sp. TS319 TaxID=3241165 RepID=UPI00351A5897